MRTWILLGCAVVTGLVSAACSSGGGGTGGSGGETTTTSSSSTTTTTSGTGGAASPCGALVWNSTNSACSACMEQSCCDELGACDTGTACADLVDCIRACSPGNDTCTKACQTAHSDGQSSLDALLGCFDTSCKETPACGTTVCDTGVSVSTQECGDCLTASCCDSWKLCSQDPACLDCLVTAAPSCQSNPLYLSAVSCQQTSCGALCATRICDTTLGYPDKPACNFCLGKLAADGGCCEATEACAADPTCLGCITGKTTTGCSTNAALSTFNACSAKCSNECN